MKYFFLIFFLIPTFCFSQNESQKSVDSLYVLINSESKDKEKIKHYIALCSIYKNSNNNDKLSITNEKLLAILKKTKAIKEYGHYFLNKAFVNYNNEKIKPSLALALKAKEIFIKNKDTLNYLIAVIHTSDCYVYFHEYQNAKNILKENLKLALRQESTIISNFYTKIAHSYIYQDSIQSGLRYYKKTIPYLSQKSSKSNALFFERLSMVYRKLRQKEKALYYIDLAVKNAPIEDAFLMEAKKAYMLNSLEHYKEALTISLKNYNTILSKNKTHLWQYNLILYNISNSYFHLNEHNAAEYYIKKVIDKKNTIVEKKIDCFILLSKICLDSDKKKLAQCYVNRALIFKDSIYPTYPNIELFTEVAKIEERLGNFEKALFYHKKKTEIEIDNLTKLNNEKVFELQTDFDLALKDKNIAVLEEEKKNNLKEKKKQTENLLYLSIMLFFAFLFLLFYVKNYNTIKKQNKIIDNDKALVKKSLLEKEILLKEIHHRVKNNMQLVISLLKIQARDTKQLSIENFIEVSENRIRSMALIHEYLYESENINYVNFEEYINRLSSSLLSSLSGHKNIKLETEIENAHFDIETSIPLGLIINELVINAFKHAFIGKDQGIIKIQLLYKGGIHHLIISDNGVGIDNKTENGTSIGLKIVKLLVSQINGMMEIKNDSGTHFIIQFKNNISKNE